MNRAFLRIGAGLAMIFVCSCNNIYGVYVNKNNSDDTLKIKPNNKYDRKLGNEYRTFDGNWTLKNDRIFFDTWKDDSFYGVYKMKINSPILDNLENKIIYNDDMSNGYYLMVHSN